MKWVIGLSFATASIMDVNLAYSYPPDFFDFVYRGKSSYNPFSRQMDNKRIYYERSCQVESFPPLDKSVICTSSGQLSVDDYFHSTSEVPVVKTEGTITGLFTLDEKRHMLVRVENASGNEAIACEIQGAYIMAVAESHSNEQVQTAVNALIFGYTLRFNIQGCERGRPRVLDFEVLNCSDRKCQDSLKTPLLSLERIRFP